jgi:hypothetical protein
MGADHHFEKQIDDQLDDDRPGFGNKEQDAADSFDDHDDQPQLRQQAEAASGAAAIEIDARFDVGFKDAEAIVKAAGGGAAQFEIDAIDVGENGESRAEAQSLEDV